MNLNLCINAKFLIDDLKYGILNRKKGLITFNHKGIFNVDAAIRQLVKRADSPDPKDRVAIILNILQV